MTASDIRTKVLSKIDKQRVISLAQELVRIPSVNPRCIGAPELSVEDNNEERIATFIANRMRQSGLDVRLLEKEKHRTNVVATLRGKGGGRSLLFNGHVDTIPVGIMDVEPFGGDMIDGMIYGRGASDMKGSVAAMIAAIEAIKEADEPLLGNLTLAAVADEEGGAKLGTPYTIQQGVVADAVIVGDSGPQVVIAHRGENFFEVKTFGKSTHGSVPSKGVNAITKMTKLITAMEQQLPAKWVNKKDALLGEPTICIGLIRGGEQPNKVPDECTIGIDRRTLPQETFEESFGEIQDIIDSLAATDVEFRAKIVPGFWQAVPFCVSPDEMIVKALRKTIKDLTGTEPACTKMEGGTDARFYAQVGIPAVHYGVAIEGKAHARDECISAETLFSVTKIYALTALNFVGVAT